MRLVSRPLGLVSLPRFVLQFKNRHGRAMLTSDPASKDRMSSYGDIVALSDEVDV